MIKQAETDCALSCYLDNIQIEKIPDIYENFSCLRRWILRTCSLIRRHLRNNEKVGFIRLFFIRICDIPYYLRMNQSDERRNKNIVTFKEKGVKKWEKNPQEYVSTN